MQTKSLLFYFILLSFFSFISKAEPLNNDQTTAELIAAKSKQGFYQATLESKKQPIPIGEFHQWLVHIETKSGEIFQPQQLVIQGGMPGHGHGFPVEPEISKYLGNGDYLIEGMKFSMSGEWQISFGVLGPSGWDTIRFDLDLAPNKLNPKASVEQWSPTEIALMNTLSLKNINKNKRDPSNKFDGNKTAIALGEKLFNDKNLSLSKTISCASCHQADKSFTDNLERGKGTQELQRNTPSLIGISHSQWFYWDGRRDSLWAQAITPIETVGEMDNNRTHAVRYFLSSPEYVDQYKKITQKYLSHTELARLPEHASPYGNKQEKAAWSSISEQLQDQINQTFSDIGKLLASYEATLQYKPTRLDQFIESINNKELNNELLTTTEQAGLKLFLDAEKTQCLRCHNGPLLTNHGFHNIGTGNFSRENSDYGRYYAILAVKFDKFNCLGKYSDAVPEDCSTLRFIIKNEIPTFMQGAFKVPSLRNLTSTAPYFHDGRYSSLLEAVEHYTKATDLKSEIEPIKLSVKEIEAMAAFLETLH